MNKPIHILVRFIYIFPECYFIQQPTQNARTIIPTVHPLKNLSRWPVLALGEAALFSLPPVIHRVPKDYEYYCSYIF